MTCPFTRKGDGGVKEGQTYNYEEKKSRCKAFHSFHKPLSLL